jgi:hypothetical protein
MNGHLHLSLEQILEYFSGSLDEYELELIEARIGECDFCAARARRAYPLTEGWTAGIQTAAAAAEARASDPLATALRRARSLYSEFEERFETWLTGPEAVWRLPGVQVASFGAAAVRVRGSRTAPLRVSLPAGTSRARVTVRRNQSVDVVAPEVADAGRPPAVVLFDPEGDTEPAVRSLARSPSTGEWTARFENVAPGEYFVALEP